MEQKPLCVCDIICDGLGRKTYFYDSMLAKSNQIGGNYERQRSDQHRYFLSNLFCDRVHYRYARYDTDLSAAAVGACPDIRRYPVYALPDKSKKIRYDMDHEYHHGNYDCHNDHGNYGDPSIMYEKKYMLKALPFHCKYSDHPS